MGHMTNPLFFQPGLWMPQTTNVLTLNLNDFRSTTNEEVVGLHPIHMDYELMCGTRMEFRVRIMKIFFAIMPCF